MKVTIQLSERKNKQYKVELPGGTVHFSHPDYPIKPGTADGDQYCTRSYAQQGAQDPYSANYWARRAWGCMKGKSKKSRAIQPRDTVTVPDHLLKD